LTDTTIALAGTAGDLGGRIATALVARGATVRALVRPHASAADLDRVTATGAVPVLVDPTDVGALAEAVADAACVVSALSGLRDVVLDRQSVLLDSAVRAGVPRFVPSDYASDFTRTEPGHNRNFDLRREFWGRADRASIAVTSVLTGAFMELLEGDMPVLQRRIRRVLHWGDPDQRLDFTTKDDVAAVTAAVALDPTTPRVLRFAGDSLSARDLATVMTDLTGERWRTLRVGSARSLDVVGAFLKRVAPEPGEVFPAWQGIAYSRDMFSGEAQLEPLDMSRYPDLTWTRVRDLLGPWAHQAA
jgi:nucleoside-diphosphate-sugar epimerase